MFLLPSPTGKPAVGVAVPLPVDSIVLEPVLDLSGIIVNKGLEQEGVANAECVIMWFIDEGS